MTREDAGHFVYYLVGIGNRWVLAEVLLLLLWRAKWSKNKISLVTAFYLAK